MTMKTILENTFEKQNEMKIIHNQFMNEQKQFFT